MSLVQARCASAARAAESAAAEREQLERKVARLEKAKETESKGECVQGRPEVGVCCATLATPLQVMAVPHPSFVFSFTA